MESRETVGWSVKYADPSRPFSSAGVPDEENRPLRLDRRMRERLRDLEQRHRPRSVVVGPVEDRVAVREA